VAPSDFLAEDLRSRGFECDVIPNILDLSQYPYAPRSTPRPHLLWMRSFHPLYNPSMALDVVARLRRQHPDARLVMAGQDKGLLGAMRARVQADGLGDAVRFPGFLQAADKRREAIASDILISTNRIDNAPVALLEAAALGLPIVATDVGGVRHLVRNEETALLVPDGDAEAMANAVSRLVADSPLAAKLVRNARALAERSDWDIIRGAWEAIVYRVWRGGKMVST
jgi:glycosyltransferase involved in cell wall biosynthesis